MAGELLVGCRTILPGGGMTGAGGAVMLAGVDGQGLPHDPARMPGGLSGGLPGVASREHGIGGGRRMVHPRQWQMAGQLPIQLTVTVPLPSVSLRVLTSLKQGQVVLSSWPSRDDVPLTAGDVFLANVTFEAAGIYLGVRISGFDERGQASHGLAAPEIPRTRLVAEGAESGSSDEDYTMNDILLPTSLCFGMKTMPLHQVLDLTSGDAIVLERTINAPVSMLASGRIVAHGELVSVKGNFGIRLATLAEMSKRLPFFHSALG